MIQKPKGTYDVYGKKSLQISYLENLFKALMEKYNYEYMRTPLFESSELFHRGVGETTDIVTKETYDFKDRGYRQMTLRPEGTAGICRSYVENKIYGTNPMPYKCWYFGPMYRYERPQSGRFREFFQFGCEVFGSDNASLDAEIISIPVTIYKLIGLKGIKVKINSLGDRESREAHRDALIKHFEPHIKTLCSDCQERFIKNPLRILDCKIDSKNELMATAPKTIDYLNETSKKHFEKVKACLEAMDIDYEVDTNIVRGLDYYNHTVFEVEADIESFGSQKVLCGGGRYNGLVEAIGGPTTSGVGFALGLERLLNAIDAENINLPVNEGVDIYIAPMSTNEEEYAIALTQNLRMNGFRVDADYMNRKIANNFKQADRLGAKFIILVGEQEVESSLMTIKNNKTKEEYKVDIDDLIEFFDDNLEGEH